MLFERELVTALEIDAGAGTVWETLTDFASYPEWNPMLKSASGELEAGARLDLCFAPSGEKARRFRPKLLVVEPGRELRWLGNPGVPGVLESQHYFIIETLPESAVRLVHGMVFYGLLSPLVAGPLLRKAKGPFEEMNRALAERASGSV